MVGVGVGVAVAVVVVVVVAVGVAVAVGVEGQMNEALKTIDALPDGARLVQPSKSHPPNQVCSGCCSCICHGVSWKPCKSCLPHHWQYELRERGQKND